VVSDPRIAALVALVNDLAREIEEARCTCPDVETRNALHTAPGRRRKDSRCSGVASAVRAEMRKRRALRKKTGEQS